MDKLDNLIIDAIKFLIAFALSWLAIYKVIMDVAREKTKQTKIEEEEKTNRAQIEAKENSLGKEALVMLRAEILELQKAKNESNIKIDKIELIIQKMELTYEFIERRMLSMFPDKNH